MVVKFYLTKPKVESKLRLVCTYNRGNQLKFSTQYSLHPKYWDAKKQCVDDSMQGSTELNHLLEQLKLDVLKQARELMLIGITEWIELKDRLGNYLKTGSTESVVVTQSSNNLSIELTSSINLFLNAKSIDYKPGTVRKYLILQSILKEFEKYRYNKITLAGVTYPLMEEFRLYMLNVRNNRNDSAYIKLACLKCLLRWLIQNNFPIDAKALEIRQAVKMKYDIVTLSENELKRIASANVNDFLKPIRDCFLFQVYTGQRFSDMQQISPEQIQGKTWIFQSVKTGKNMQVPLVGWSKVAWDIGEKYGFSLPKYTGQYFNRALTKICYAAGITELVTLNRYQGSKSIQISKPKCEFISSHTARRTCVSLLLLKGVPPTVVMKLTGHTSIQTMMKYERTTNEALFNALSVL
jgi:integrase